MVVQDLNSENVVEEFKRLVKARPKKLITVSIDLRFFFHTKKFGHNVFRGKDAARQTEKKRIKKKTKTND